MNDSTGRVRRVLLRFARSPGDRTTASHRKRPTLTKESGMRTSGRTRKAAVIAVAGLAACATLITGCSSNSKDDSKGSSSDEQITLRIGDFGSFGYDDKTG